MTETDIRNAFGRATDHLTAPPDLLDRVRTGGRRRQVRRRTVLTAGLVVAGAGAFVPAAVRRVSGPPSGDDEFRSRALAAWRSGVGGFDPFGDPVVHWAGDTPAGPVALIAQRTSDRGAVTGSGDVELLGFVETLGDRVKLAGEVQVVPAGTVPTTGLLAGRGRDVLVLAGDNAAVRFSADYTIDAAGRIARDWSSIGPTADGVTVIAVGDQTEGIRIALRSNELTVPLANLGDVIDLRTGTENQIPELIERRLPGWEKAWAVTESLSRSELDRWSVIGRDGYNDPFGYHVWTGPSPWSVRQPMML